jgi:putative oxidoreductase
MHAPLLFGRFFFSILFIIAGFGHFSDSTITYAQNYGVPYVALLVPLSGLLAIFGGLSILLGYRARIGAWALVVFLVPVTLAMHAFWTVDNPANYQIQMSMFMKNLALLGGAFTYAYFGSGAYSVESRIKTSESNLNVGSTTSMAGTVIPQSLRTETQAEIAASIAKKSNDSSRLTGMW